MRKSAANKTNHIVSRYQFIRIVTGTDLSKRRIPVMMVDTGVAGPCVWITACIHGDEIAGTVIIQELFKLLKKRINRGRVYAFPIVNPFGFEQKTRYIPYSREDLNRLFPGNEKGSLGERIAAVIFSRIIADRPDLVLDLHNDWIRSIPYTLLDRDFRITCSTEMAEKLQDYAFELGFPVVLDTDHISGSLSGMLLKHGVPALTLELGASNFVDEMNISQGVTSIYRLLRKIGVVDREIGQDYGGDQPPLPGFPEFMSEILTYSQTPLSSTSGIIRFYTDAGQKVGSGQLIARIYNAFGKIQESLRAENDGLVLGCSDTSLSFPGFPVMAFGIPNKL